MIPEATASVDAPRLLERARRWLVERDALPSLAVLGCVCLLVLAMKLLDPPANLLTEVGAVLVTSIFLAVASFGQGLAILIGGIDLSIGVVMGIGGIMVAGLTRGSDAALAFAVPITLACCAGIGVVNGIGIALLKVPPFIMTLSSATAFFGAALGLTEGGSQQAVAPSLQRLMSAQWHSMPLSVLALLAFLLVALVLQNCTAEGRKLYAIGSSPRAALILGLPIVGLTVGVYAISGFCAGLAGMLLAGYSSSATLDMGDAYLTPTIAAVVIGGARVTGGRGIYLGTFAGALFLGALQTITTVLDLSQGLRDIIQGTIIVAALMLQSGRWTWRRVR